MTHSTTVAGRPAQAADGRPFDVVNPATGRTIASSRAPARPTWTPLSPQRRGPSRDRGARGRPWSVAVRMASVLDSIERGENEGARLVTGGRRMTGQSFDGGTFVSPAVFDGATSSMRIVQEEILGRRDRDGPFGG